MGANALHLMLPPARHPGFADVAIAALAQNAHLLLLTCNIKHFEPLGAVCADPLIALPTE